MGSQYCRRVALRRHSIFRKSGYRFSAENATNQVTERVPIQTNRNAPLASCFVSVPSVTGARSVLRRELPFMRRFACFFCCSPRCGVFWFLTRPATIEAGASGRTRPTWRMEEHVLCRRLRVLPRHSQPGGQDQARRRDGFEIAVRHFLCAEYLFRCQGRHRRLDRSEFRHRHVEGHLARRPPLLSGLPVYRRTSG